LRERAGQQRAFAVIGVLIARASKRVVALQSA
jgi:hypothetical protein